MGRNLNVLYTLAPCQSIPHLCGRVLHLLSISRASNVTDDSLASRTESVKTSISYNKISGEVVEISM